jgi:hypothetical protein
VPPWDAEGPILTVDQVETSTLAETMTVVPQQLNRSMTGPRCEWVPPDRSLYRSSAAWPKLFIRFAGIRRTGGLAVAAIEICPFQYHPRARRLDLIKKLSFSVPVPTDGEETREVTFPRRARVSFPATDPNPSNGSSA